MKKQELRQIIKEEISKALNNNTFIYKKDGGGGRPTMILLLKPEAWDKVAHLFDEAGRPKDELKRIPYNKTSWSLHASKPYNRSTLEGTETIRKIYGVSGDYTFGNAPTFYQQKLRGNIKASKYIFDYFINIYNHELNQLKTQLK